MAPLSNGLIRHSDASFGQHLFDFTEAEAEKNKNFKDPFWPNGKVSKAAMEG